MPPKRILNLLGFASLTPRRLPVNWPGRSPALLRDWERSRGACRGVAPERRRPSRVFDTAILQSLVWEPAALRWLLLPLHVPPLYGLYGLYV